MSNQELGIIANVLVTTIDKNGIENKYEAKNKVTKQMLIGIAKFLRADYDKKNDYQSFVPRYLGLGSGVDYNSNFIKGEINRDCLVSEFPEISDNSAYYGNRFIIQKSYDVSYNEENENNPYVLATFETQIGKNDLKRNDNADIEINEMGLFYTSGKDRYGNDGTRTGRRRFQQLLYGSKGSRIRSKDHKLYR